jgi:SAM-dependent methyltransferase
MSVAKAKIKAAVDRRLAPRVMEVAPQAAPALMQFAHYWAHDPGSSTYARPVTPVAGGGGKLPVPPRDYWAYYCTTAESYLASGEEDVAVMRRLLANSGAPAEEAGRILELGCAGGRMIRHLTDLPPAVQVWGCDIWASAILWCQDHLSPPFWFAVNTMAPHLPFEDRSFGLVYCGSLFTHIDDLAETWFLELRRILRPGGRLYFSVNDRHAQAIFDGRGDPAAYPRYWERSGGKAAWDVYVEAFERVPGYGRLRDGDAYMVTKGRSLDAQVMWDADVLCERLAYGWRCCSVTPEGYGHQTVILLERL